MSQHHSHPHPSTNAFYTEPKVHSDESDSAIYPTPPPTDTQYPFVSTSYQPYQQPAPPDEEVPQQADPAPYPYTFSPTQLSALLDERIRQLGTENDGETDMDLGAANFATLNRTYRITPIQQPERSAAFVGDSSYQYLERLPLSPPLILQFDCWDAHSQQEIPHDELPFLVVHVTLETPDGENATMAQLPSGDVVDMIHGTVVAPATQMQSTEGSDGVYFCFPDVSVRYPGQYKLRADLMRVTGGQRLATADTDVFEIVPQAGYVAPVITDLTRHFDAQGQVRFGLPRREW